MINEEPYPLNGTFELTGRCNLSCKMCLVRIGQQQICESGMRERTAGEWIDMAEQVRDAGTFSLLLTGGEVMLRPDFCEIYEAISKMGFILTVYTNATMVTDEIMGMFKKHPLIRLVLLCMGHPMRHMQKCVAVRMVMTGLWMVSENFPPYHHFLKRELLSLRII